MTLEIVKVPNKILLTKAEDVFDFSKMTDVIPDMIRVAIQNGLVGLSGNQVGLLQRVFIVRVGEEVIEEKLNVKYLTFVNPVVRPIREAGKKFDWEGCGSIPNTGCLVERWNKVDVTAQNSAGDTFEMNGTGLLARVIQHENDHLNGVLITSKARQIKRG